MQIISGVKIRYFRSAYAASLANCKSLNIISGKNDVGKSNILKALNLFFNEETDWNTYFDFQTDFSTERRQLVKESVKGKQFVSIEIEFTRPPNYKGSLPPKFKVTKTWLRDDSYQESNNLEYYKKKDLLPSTFETAKRFLSQFLHRIHCEYVPAVKDRHYYNHLLSTLQIKLLDTPLDSSTAPLVGNLASHIQGQIGQLQSEFTRATGIETLIQPPEELASLFQSFEVSTTSGSGPIPLILRGDGIQARYVPSVLHYISSRSNEFFVWGFEEPENCLEYSRVNVLARDFEQTYSKEAQIFITSHSPALISLRDHQTSCYRAFKKNDRTDIIQVWPDEGALEASEQGELLRKELGILEIQEEVHREYAKKLSELDDLHFQIKGLQDDLVKFGKPLLLVEGKYDKIIIETVWAKLFVDIDPPFTVRVADPAANTPGGGAAGAQYVAKTIEVFHPEEGRKAIGLFDRDDEGIKCFFGLSKNFKDYQGNQDIKIHKNGLSFAVLLPAPDYRHEYVFAKNLALEFLFPDEVLHRKTNKDKGLELSNPELTILAGKQRLLVDDEIIEQLKANLTGYTKIISGKDVFAHEIVPGCTLEECESFRDLFSTLLSLYGITFATHKINFHLEH